VNIRACMFISAAISSCLLSLAGVGAGPAVAAPSSAPTVVYGFGDHCPSGHWSNPGVRPARAWFSLACEDGIRSIRWATWRRASAFGHGKHLLFNGIGFTPQRATITLSRVRLHNGHRYFSHLIIKWTTKNGTHHRQIYNWKHLKLGWFWS
jgi:hypothetical protein